MNPKSTEPLYKVYRIFPGVASPLTSLFQKLDQSPENPRIHFELGEAAHQAGVLELAMECFSRVTELAPDVEAGFFNLGNALFELRQYDDARQAYERAFALEPDHGTLNNLGNSFAAMEEWEKAIHAYDRALRLANCPPNQARYAIRNKGRALVAAKRWDDALENYLQASLRFPNDIEFLSLTANCHYRRFEFGKAVECLVEALVASPNNPELLCQIADLNFCRGRTLESLLCLNQAFAVAPPPLAWLSRRLEMLNYFADASPDIILREAMDWAQSLPHCDQSSATELTVAEGLEKSAPKPERPLRIGLLCNGLPSRGLGDWLPDCLKLCDPSKLEWLLYSDQPVNRQTQNAIAQAGCRIEDTSRLSDAAQASLIGAHQLAVLVDMIGHGRATRMQVIARKPAPVQVAWCAFPMTSGLTQMDFIWSDQVAIPTESERFLTEQVIRFPQSAFCFRPSCSIDLKDERDAAHSPFCVGFLGRSDQITDSFIVAIRMILERIADAELVFIGQEYRDLAFQSEIRGKLENPSANSSRIRFECFESAAEELNSYQQLDVSLDPFFVNSPQRAFESLWMGVPVITYFDERLSGRSTASILDSLDRKSWIANNQGDYVNAVQQLAELRTISRSQRSQLRSELLASPMCDVALIAKYVQAAIDEAIHRVRLGTRKR